MDLPGPTGRYCNVCEKPTCLSLRIGGFDAKETQESGRVIDVKHFGLIFSVTHKPPPHKDAKDIIDMVDILSLSYPIDLCMGSDCFHNAFEKILAAVGERIEKFWITGEAPTPHIRDRRESNERVCVDCKKPACLSISGGEFEANAPDHMGRRVWTKMNGLIFSVTKKAPPSFCIEEASNLIDVVRLSFPIDLCVGTEDGHHCAHTIFGGFRWTAIIKAKRFWATGEMP